MRVSEGASKPSGSADATRTKRFADALRRARPERNALAARPAAASAARAPVARRGEADRKDAALAARRDGFREEERASAPAGPAAAPPSVPEPAAPELRALVRALPPAIAAARVRDGAPLSLSFGRSLGVDIRVAPAGVELVLRPDARLARGAEAELPRLVAALRARGLAVARAEVRTGGTAATARVDVPSPLR